MHLYLCAFHIAKKNPRFQIEAHHYCSPVADEVHQCIIFDASGPHARILGVEYIISDRLYQELPDEEKKYYHPHAYEVLSGQLIAPGLSEAEEKKLFRGLITTWGKTWHTWPDPKTPLPMGEPILMWSINRDGQIDSTLLANRDRRLQVSSAEIRQARAAYGYEVPSVGPPKSVDEVGRRWTDNGPDVPRRK
ncbi:MAG: OBAP family protein [Isosphaeraceae bacterium]|nr:OBAP family protein [Isosphaeraceae bacterium]